MDITKEQHQLLLHFQKQEITGHAVYLALARNQKDPHNRNILNRIASDEMSHYLIYKKLTGRDISKNRFEVFKYTVLSWLLGPTFAIKLMEKNEADAQVSYARLSHFQEINPIIRDEELHEKELIGMINEQRLNYMGSVVLGLNDALVELTGALAGLTLALQNPQLIALTGSITGIAAAFSMAASEYLSTKSENTGKHAYTAAIYTGIAYILTVILLILPFLLIHNVYISLVLTISVAVLIIAAFNYYYAVVKDEKFIRRFSEMAMLSLSVAALSFGVGFVLRKFFGIDI
jgi:VIT1/CCC1 family predicted Fe2+/Mn2+ transporter